MTPATDALIAELERETPATRRVLERVPADQFAWRPHKKSLSAGELAQHVAAIPGNVARMAGQDGVDLATRPMVYPSCDSKEGLLATLDASVTAAREFLSGLDDASARALWRARFGERELFTIPRLEVVRMIGLNHWYHHRGELVVYLRMLDVPVPIVYGKSADENPFS
jgi:uncharacterized damage-inducible protein DinB